MSANVATLLLGSNLGNPEENIRKAITLLKKQCTIVATGDLHASEPEGFSSENLFTNIAIAINTNLSPVGLLTFIKHIEKEMGRLADSSSLKTYEDRIIDIDIVTFSNLTYLSDNLSIPHQLHLYTREFSQPVLASLEKNLTKTEF